MEEYRYDFFCCCRKSDETKSSREQRVKLGRRHAMRNLFDENYDPHKQSTFDLVKESLLMENVFRRGTFWKYFILFARFSHSESISHILSLLLFLYLDLICTLSITILINLITWDMKVPHFFFCSYSHALNCSL